MELLPSLIEHDEFIGTALALRFVSGEDVGDSDLGLCWPIFLFGERFLCFPLCVSSILPSSVVVSFCAVLAVACASCVVGVLESASVCTASASTVSS